MPITVSLDEMLGLRQMSLTELSEAVDITLANLSILKTGKAKAIRFSTLEAICKVLECQPGDLLAFTRRRVTEFNDFEKDKETSMTFNPKAIFERSARYEGVRPINIYLLRLLYVLMFFVLGRWFGCTS